MQRPEPDEIVKLTARLIELDKDKRGAFMQTLGSSLTNDSDRKYVLSVMVGQLVDVIDTMNTNRAIEDLAAEGVEDIYRLNRD